jgi:KipI family sensor histidine kinase inhibitor
LRPLPRVLPVGDSAVTVEFGDCIDPPLNARVRALDRAVTEDPVPGFLEAVPTHRSLLVLYDGRRLDFDTVRESLLLRAKGTAEDDARGVLRIIPTLYGGDAGPDLAEIARSLRLSEEEVIRLHAGRDYTAFMLGFTPGFAYLGPLTPGLASRRRSTPRLRVPRGSVAIAGSQTGVYPVDSPGGWNLLGQTSVRLFDPQAQPPALILPGDLVRFVPVDRLDPPETPYQPRVRGTGRVVQVLDGGLFTTVQDSGRREYRRMGVAGAGPMDPPALRRANLLVGNPQGAAALECTLTGPTLRFCESVHFALTGADLGAVLERADLGEWTVPLGARVFARPENVLRFRGRRRGSRGYLAFEGGVEVPLVLASSSTDVPGAFGGFEGRALRAGDLLPLGPRQRSGEVPPPSLEISGEATLRVVLGPQHDQLEPLATFLQEPYTLATTSDRTGSRLLGPPLSHRGSAEIVSDGMVMGSVEVAADGQPMVMMADCPTTGGYPKVATVITVDLPLLAQLVPGEGRVRFAAVSVEEAQRQLRKSR